MKNHLLLLLIAFVTTLSAQKTVELKLDLLDGSIITGTSQMGDIELSTSYGKLVLPVASVSTIKIGLGRDKMAYDKAISSLKIMSNSGSDEARKGAYNDVLKIGAKAIAAVTDFLNDPKNYSDNSTYTGDFTIDNLLTELRSAANIDESASIDDIVTIDNQYTMGGAFSFQKLDVKTDYGSLSIPKEKIRSVDISVISPSGAGGEYNFRLMASKHISGNQNGGWLKTGITLKTGQHFSINSSGEVTLASLSNQKYKPDGSYSATTGASYPASNETYESTAAYPSYGNVVYKIGDSSADAMRAGARFSGTAKSSGMLYISIYETVFNAANTGAYSVKISLK